MRNDVLFQTRWAGAPNRQLRNMTAKSTHMVRRMGTGMGTEGWDRKKDEAEGEDEDMDEHGALAVVYFEALRLDKGPTGRQAAEFQSELRHRYI